MADPLQIGYEVPLASVKSLAARGKSGCNKFFID
jgi:hypothetical protein